jgi:hypothetical protein
MTDLGFIRELTAKAPSETNLRRGNCRGKHRLPTIAVMSVPVYEKILSLLLLGAEVLVTAAARIAQGFYFLAYLFILGFCRIGQIGRRFFQFRRVLAELIPLLPDRAQSAGFFGRVARSLKPEEIPYLTISFPTIPFSL